MVLDLACGTGHSTFELCNHYQRTVGVVISIAQLEQARENATILGKSGEVELSMLLQVNYLFLTHQSIFLPAR